MLPPRDVGALPALTVAVRIKACPAAIGLGAATSDIVVGLSDTVTSIAWLVEAALFESPEYTALMLCTPGVRVLTLHAAVALVPLLARPTAAQSTADPSRKVTAPVGERPDTA